MNQISNQFLSIEQVTDQYLNRSQNFRSNALPDIPFEEILRQKQSQNVMEQSELKFSKHATSLQSSSVPKVTVYAMKP